MTGISNLRFPIVTKMSRKSLPKYKGAIFMGKKNRKQKVFFIILMIFTGRNQELGGLRLKMLHHFILISYLLELRRLNRSRTSVVLSDWAGRI